MRGGEVAKVLRQESRLVARWEQLVAASLDWGRQTDELRMVPAQSETDTKVRGAWREEHRKYGTDRNTYKAIIQE